MSKELNYFDIRDELVEDGTVFSDVSHVSETMRIAFDMPYDIGYMADSIDASNSETMDTELDKLATLLDKKLPKDMGGVDEQRFLIHKSVKVRELNGEGDKRRSEKVYLPFTLRFMDGQTLTALVTNQDVYLKKFNPHKALKVHRWAINNKDITKFIGEHDDDSAMKMSSSELTTKLSKLLTKTHNNFVKKNPHLTVVDDLSDELKGMELNLARKEWIRQETAVNDDGEVNSDDNIPVIRVEPNLDTEDEVNDKASMEQEIDVILSNSKDLSTDDVSQGVADISDRYGLILTDEMKDKVNTTIANKTSSQFERISSEIDEMMVGYEGINLSIRREDDSARLGLGEKINNLIADYVTKNGVAVGLKALRDKVSTFMDKMRDEENYIDPVNVKSAEEVHRQVANDITDMMKSYSDFDLEYKRTNPNIKDAVIRKINNSLDALSNGATDEIFKETTKEFEEWKLRTASEEEIRESPTPVPPTADEAMKKASFEAGDMLSKYEAIPIEERVKNLTGRTTALKEINEKLKEYKNVHGETDDIKEVTKNIVQWVQKIAKEEAKARG